MAANRNTNSQQEFELFSEKNANNGGHFKFKIVSIIKKKKKICPHKTL